METVVRDRALEAALATRGVRGAERRAGMVRAKDRRAAMMNRGDEKERRRGILRGKRRWKKTQAKDAVLRGEREV